MPTYENSYLLKKSLFSSHIPYKGSECQISFTDFNTNFPEYNLILEQKETLPQSEETSIKKLFDIFQQKLIRKIKNSNDAAKEKRMCSIFLETTDYNVFDMIKKNNTFLNNINKFCDGKLFTLKAWVIIYKNLIKYH